MCRAIRSTLARSRSAVFTSSTVHCGAAEWTRAAPAGSVRQVTTAGPAHTLNLRSKLRFTIAMQACTIASSGTRSSFSSAHDLHGRTFNARSFVQKQACPSQNFWQKPAAHLLSTPLFRRLTPVAVAIAELCMLCYASAGRPYGCAPSLTCAAGWHTAGWPWQAGREAPVHSGGVSRWRQGDCSEQSDRC